MDPDETLRRIRRLLVESYDRDLEEDEQTDLCDLMSALDNWLSRGGFLPRSWDVPRGRTP